MGINDDMKKILLAGIGAVAVTAERSKTLLDELITKGEITVEQGKVLNEELKRNVQESFKKHSPQSHTEKPTTTTVVDMLDNLNPEEIAMLKRKLAEMENKEDGVEKTEE
ncbi:phasin family protein [Brevibacillus daliensis]|uniref:phasin family protein n=1 Tax=Brevibacillus daliensis TaxID=2892995 RepID=UPI001E3524A1|nr:aspartyl beta-hydroxylase [Brevibacillus daliensis]